MVKTAYEVRRRHEQHLHAVLHKKVVVRSGEGEYVVTLDIVPDEDQPYATLTARTARDRDGVALAELRVAASFKLTDASAVAWIENGYRRPD